MGSCSWIFAVLEFLASYSLGRTSGREALCVRYMGASNPPAQGRRSVSRRIREGVPEVTDGRAADQRPALSLF